MLGFVERTISFKLYRNSVVESNRIFALRVFVFDAEFLIYLVGTARGFGGLGFDRWW